MKLYTSGEDYLEAILTLGKELPVVRSVDVARKLGLTKSSVSHAMRTLREGGYLTMNGSRYIELTDAEREIADRIYERHCLFRIWLIGMGVSPQTADVDACRIEHCVSEKTFAKLKEHFAEWQSDKMSG